MLRLLIGLDQVSIHAPVKGATWGGAAAALYGVYFNPHAREGRDHMDNFDLFDCQSFNPHARDGRDAALGITTPTPEQFQSTRP